MSVEEPESEYRFSTLQSSVRLTRLLECNKARSPGKMLEAGGREWKELATPMQTAGMCGPPSPALSLRYPSDFGLRVRRTNFHSITIGPTVLHGNQHETGKNDDEQKEPALFGPQMHEEQQRQSSFGNGYQQHALEFCRRIGVAESDNKLQGRQYQKAKID
jgi:hypothetical protein